MPATRAVHTVKKEDLVSPTAKKHGALYYHFWGAIRGLWAFMFSPLTGAKRDDINEEKNFNGFNYFHAIFYPPFVLLFTKVLLFPVGLSFAVPMLGMLQIFNIIVGATAIAAGLAALDAAMPRLNLNLRQRTAWPFRIINSLNDMLAHAITSGAEYANKLFRKDNPTGVMGRMADTAEQPESVVLHNLNPQVFVNHTLANTANFTSKLLKGDWTAKAKVQQDVEDGCDLAKTCLMHAFGK